jgi:hypothetical protein
MPGNVGTVFEHMHLKFAKSADTTQTHFYRTKLYMGYQTTLNFMLIQN